MNKIFSTIVLISIITFLNADTNIEHLKQLHKNHNVKKPATWEGWQETPLINRIKTAPNNIIDYIRLDNKIFGFEGIPQKAPFDKNFNNSFINAMEELPPTVLKQLKKYLIGIFFVTDLGSTGFSEHVYKKGKYEGGFILFDQNVLSKLKANHWASWRVNSAFKKDKDYKLSITLEEKRQNNTKQAIQFILLHEIGHIIGLSHKAHPKDEKGDPKHFSYSSISWSSFETSIYDKKFKNRKDFKIYRFDKAKLDIKESKDLIENLKKTDFCSLYGTNNFFEDFAEGYAVYVHTIMMNKPYILNLSCKDEILTTYQNPFSTKNMAEKKEYFDDLLK